MDNSAALKKGTAMAKRIIEDHMYAMLTSAAKKLLDDATNGRITIGHNMTGNTVNSYAVGVYSKGNLVFMMSSADGIPHPLRRKLSKGEIFQAGRQRWDGTIQETTFRAEVSTNGSMEAERSIAFIKSFRPSAKSWVLVVCNGVEYASYQESQMDIDVLTGNYNYAQMFAPSMFNPMPD